MIESGKTRKLESWKAGKGESEKNDEPITPIPPSGFLVFPFSCRPAFPHSPAIFFAASSVQPPPAARDSGRAVIPSGFAFG